MKSPNAHTQTIGEAARELGVSNERVRQLDHVLKPIRIGSSKIRLYDPANVEALKRERARRAG